MKKVLVGLVVMVALVASIAVAWNPNGWGDTLSVTNVDQRVEITGGVFNLKIVNDGAVPILASINCTAAEFTVIQAAGTAVVIAPTDDYTFEGYKDRSARVSIESVNVVSTTAATNAVYLAGW